MYLPILEFSSTCMRKPDLVFKILIYASLIFVIIFLWRFDYLKLDLSGLNYGWLIISLLLLWSGFFLSAVSWRYALYYHNVSIPHSKAVISHGLSVFAKYIPGKIWVILGRASYVSQGGVPLKETSFISLKEQLLYILLGLMISAFPSILYFGLNYLNIILLVTCILLALILFNKPVHNLAEKILSRLFRKEFTLPQLSMRLSGKLSGFILLYWALWILAFYALCKALIPEVGFISTFAFPLSVCYGVLAIVMPGGLGVREGIMVAFLTLTGIETELALSLSVIARLWFVTGEIFIFLTALLLKNLKKVAEAQA